MAKKSGTYVLAPSKRSAAQKKQVAKDAARHEAAVARRKSYLHEKAIARRKAAKYPRDPGARAVLVGKEKRKATRTAKRYNGVPETQKERTSANRRALIQLTQNKRRFLTPQEKKIRGVGDGKGPVAPDIRDITKGTKHEQKAVYNRLLKAGKIDTPGGKLLGKLDKLYESGDKAAKSVSPALRSVLEHVPTLKLKPSSALKNKKGVEVRKSTKKESKEQVKALGKVATSPLKAAGTAAKGVKKVAEKAEHGVQFASKKAKGKVERLPGGKTAVKAAGVASLPVSAPAKGVKAAGKAAWNSDEVIKAAAAGKSVKKIAAASQGKEKTSGQSLAKSLGVNPKTHKGANILVGGAIDFAAQAPLAAATGGSGTVAETAAKTAGKKAFEAEVKSAVKKAGVRNLTKLPKAKQERILKSAEAAREKASANAAAHASAKYGRQRELRVGIDVRKPGGGRIEKTLPVTRPVTIGRAKAARRLDKIERSTRPAKGGAGLPKHILKMLEESKVGKTRREPIAATDLSHLGAGREGVSRYKAPSKVTRTPSREIQVGLSKKERERLLKAEELATRGTEEGERVAARRAADRLEAKGRQKIVVKGKPLVVDKVPSDLHLVMRDGRGKPVGEIVGKVEGKEVHSFRVSVVPEARGKGVAKTLVQRAQEELKARGLSYTGRDEMLTSSGAALARSLVPRVPTRRARAVGAMRDKVNRLHTRANTRAKSRHMGDDEAMVIEGASREARAAKASAERDANNLYEALTSALKKGDDPRPYMVKIEHEIERLGPNADSPVARQLHAVREKAHTALVERGLAEPYGGQKIKAWDNKGLAKMASRGRSKMKRRASVARANVKTAIEKAASTKADTRVGNATTKVEGRVVARDTGETATERIAGASARRKENFERIQAEQEARATTANREVEKIHTQIRNLAARPNSEANLKKLEGLKDDLSHQQALYRIAKNNAKSAERGAKRAGRSATSARKQVGEEAVAASREHAKTASVNAKEHEKLVKLLAAAPETKNIEETTAQLEDFAKKFEALGDKSTATKLRNKAIDKMQENPYYSSRAKLRPEPATKAPPNPNTSLKIGGHRVLRKRSAVEAFESGKVDYRPETVVKEIRSRQIKATESDYWHEVSKVLRDKGEGHSYYAVSRNGLSKAYQTEDEARRSLDGAEGFVGRLDKTSVQFLQRKAQVHHAEFDPNDWSRGWRRGIGGWKRVAITTPTNFMRNLVGDTTRSVALGGSGVRHSGAALRVARAELKRQELERSGARFADDVSVLGHRITSPELDKILQQKITVGTGAAKHHSTIGEELAAMERQGILESGVIRSDVLTGGVHDAEVHKPGKLAKIDRAVSAREITSRAHLFLSGRTAGLSEREAAELVRKALIDYGDVSQLEEVLRRNLIPFVVFKGRNIATWTGHIVRKPGKIKQYQTIFDTSAQLAGFKDYKDFEKNAGEVAQTLPLPIPKSLQALGLNVVNPSLPVGDLYNTYKQVSDVHDIGTAIGQQMFAARLLLDLAPRLIKGKPSTESSKQLPVNKTVGEFLMKHERLVKTFRLSKGLNFDGKPAYFGHPAVMDALGLTPESGAIARAGSASGGGPWYTPILNFFSGAGAMSIKPNTGELQKVRKQLDDLGIQLDNPLPSEAARSNLYKKREKLKKKRNELYAGQGVKWAQEATGKKPSTGGATQSLPKGWK